MSRFIVATRASLSASAAAVSVVAFALLGACSDDPGTGEQPCVGEFCVEDAPRLELQPNETILEIADQGMADDESVVRTIRAVNQGTGALTIEDVSLSYEVPVGADDRGTPAFELISVGTLPTDLFRFGGDQFPQGFDIQVRYTKRGDATPRTGELCIRSNSIVDSTQCVTLTTDTGIPRIGATPLPLDFGLVPKDERSTKTLTLLNTGTRDLQINGFRIVSDGRFGILLANGEELSGPEAALGVDLSEAITVPALESAPLQVFFESDSPAPAEADLIIFSDDPTNPDGFIVPLEANKSGPCIQVNPRFVAFGGKTVGSTSTIDVELRSCGTEPVEIKSLSWQAASSSDFTFDFDGLGEGYAEGPTAQNPLVIGVNDAVEFQVVFVPDAVNPRDADNIPIPDQGTILINSNAFESEVEVEVEGAGSDVDCPTPIIVIEEGEEVIPQTVLHLDGSESFAPFGSVTQYNWSVAEFPEETTSPLLVPSFTDPQPVVEVNVVGTYVFALDVGDEFGNRSGNEECPTALYTVIVQPDQAIHVELSWLTPGDPDETDTGEGVGTDLDLHFAHEYATGPDLDFDGFPDPWFDTQWDVFWFNQSPNWESLDPNANDDPSLDRDDTDGGGPENLNLALPADGSKYLIGAHFWNDFGFGEVDATIKVFHYADLIYEATLPSMQPRDMWWIGEIVWPEPLVVRRAPEGEPEYVVPAYDNHFFQFQ